MNRALGFVLVAVLMGAAEAAAADAAFRATLTGGQEAPLPVTTEASGSATLSLDDSQTRLLIRIDIVGLDLDGLQTPGISSDDVIGAHIHRAPPGVNGTIVFGMIGPSSDLNGDLIVDPVGGTITSAWDAAEGNAGETLTAQLASLLTGNLYINIHTAGNTDGEIRGQIDPIPADIAGTWDGTLTVTEDGCQIPPFSGTDSDVVRLELTQSGGSFAGTATSDLDEPEDTFTLTFSDAAVDALGAFAAMLTGTNPDGGTETFQVSGTISGNTMSLSGSGAESGGAGCKLIELSGTLTRAVAAGGAGARIIPIVITPILE